jgi:Flp pilus assembly protein TadG
MRQHRDQQRGFALATAVVMIFAFFALIVVAIDIGRISHTATEVQGIADSAAIAGALAVAKQGAGNASPAATTAANSNRFDGRTFVAGTNGVLTVQEGNWNPASASSFSPGSTPVNAVRATVTGQNVRYITAPLIGISPTSDIQKLAVAVIAAPSTAVATLPLSVCSDVGNGVSPQPDGPCANGDGTVIKTLPDLVQQGNQNSCFTGLDLLSHNASDEGSELPAPCGGTHASSLSVGQDISLDNGQQNSVLKAIGDCVGPAKSGNANNVHRFVLPVIGNCNCSGTTLPVIGFVTLQIDDPSQVISQGGSKRITGAKQVCDSQLSGGSIGIAAGDFGSKEVRLAQ